MGGVWASGERGRHPDFSVHEKNSAWGIFLAAQSIAPEKGKMPIVIPDPASRPDYYTMREFAELFGRERRWTKRLVDAGKIRSIKVDDLSRQLYIPADQIEVLMRRTDLG
jgi:hypothetical protein